MNYFVQKNKDNGSNFLLLPSMPGKQLSDLEHQIFVAFAIL